jgi:hypothetical protein
LGYQSIARGGFTIGTERDRAEMRTRFIRAHGFGARWRSEQCGSRVLLDGALRCQTGNRQATVASMEAWSVDQSANNKKSCGVGNSLLILPFEAKKSRWRPIVQSRKKPKGIGTRFSTSTHALDLRCGPFWPSCAGDERERDTCCLSAGSGGAGGALLPYERDCD